MKGSFCGSAPVTTIYFYLKNHLTSKVKIYPININNIFVMSFPKFLIRLNISSASHYSRLLTYYSKYPIIHSKGAPLGNLSECHGNHDDYHKKLDKSIIFSGLHDIRISDNLRSKAKQSAYGSSRLIF